MKRASSACIRKQMRIGEGQGSKRPYAREDEGEGEVGGVVGAGEGERTSPPMCAGLLHAMGSGSVPTILFASIMKFLASNGCSSVATWAHGSDEVRSGSPLRVA